MGADGDRTAPGVGAATPQDAVLGSWKEIAAYLQRDVRTVMRWEQTRGLPVHRLPGGPKAAIYALKSELEAWRAAGAGAAGEPQEGTPEGAAAGPRPLAWQPFSLRPVLVPAAILALIVGSAAMVRLLWPPAGSGGPAIHSLAVLPFQNLNKDPAQDYFADGMHETLITGLARASGIPVTARTSVDVYRGTRTPTRQIARELGVDALVEGSVLRVGNRVRITAQLVRGDNGEHIWANSYDQDVADVLALMARVSDTITGEIRKAVQGGAQPDEAPPLPRRVSPDVLDSYLRGRYAAHGLSADGLAHALTLYRQTTALDPDFALGWNGIGATRTGQAFFGFVAARDVLPEARDAARRALSLDPRLGEAYGTLGYIALYWDWNFEAAGRTLERAVVLSPNNMAVRHQYADYLLVKGNVAGSLEQVRAGLVTNPMSPVARGILLYHSLMARRYADVVSQGAAVSDSSPLAAAAQDYLGRALWLQGRHQDALARWQRAYQRDDREVAVVAKAYASGGPNAALRTLAERAAARAQGDLQAGAVHTAALFAAAGDARAALDWLARAYQRREPFILHIAADPFFDPIRSDPAFRALLQRIGITARPR